MISKVFGLVATFGMLVGGFAAQAGDPYAAPSQQFTLGSSVNVAGCGNVQYSASYANVQVPGFASQLVFLNQVAAQRFLQNLQGLRIAKVVPFDSGYFGVQNVSGAVQIVDHFGHVFVADAFGNIQFVGTNNSAFGKRLVKQNVQDILRLERLLGRRVLKLY